MRLALLGSMLTLITVIAFGYGYDASLTAHGFILKGYVGAIIPPMFVLLGAWGGALLMQEAK